MSKNDSSHSAHRVPPYRRPIIVVGFLAVLAAAIAITIAIFMNFNHEQEPTPKPSTPAPATPVVTKPKDEEEQPSEPEDKVDQYEGEDPNSLNELTGRVAYKGVNREPNYQTLTISASIDQYLQSNGTCALSLKNSNGTEVYSASLPAQPDVTTSACGPFEISIADLSPGAYQIEIAITGDGKTGLITDAVQL